MKINGNVVDIHARSIYAACVTIENGKVKKIEKIEGSGVGFIIPGLIDAHIHIESSMITPGAFAVEAVKHGTVATVSDPHEIANVCGIEGVDFMIEDAARVPLKMFFGAPSCVPATSFETNGASLDKDDVREMLQRNEIKYLSEMMNFPGVIHDDEQVHNKILYARKFGKPIDGHAPGLTGRDLEKYVSAGISTDHECSTINEALEKISLGMKILIREGSAAKNLDSLKELYNMFPDQIMLCSDDLHPEMLLKGHINKLIARLISEGYNLFDVIRSATINPGKHYNIDTGLLREGDNADLILVDDLESMNILETWIDGKKVFDRGIVAFNAGHSRGINNFNCSIITNDNIQVVNQGKKIRIIEAYDGDLLTKEKIISTGSVEILRADTDLDHLKIVVKDRYNDTAPVCGFVKGFNLKRGAFAGSVAHDSHNIICVGTNDNDIVSAVNKVIEMKGGLSFACDNKIYAIKLNIGGIMTSNSCRETAHEYEKLNEIVKKMGCTMSAPFMTLAFMALLVIPDLKIGDRGLFDVNKFGLVPLFVE
ncbi:MAG: adenine deaminase [Bacteroidetes bacterium GWE2_41_25]|nr:MAG: adenine deaminase [Bacteroidetes bacterium GWA2_40_15]OFX82748.1 MAG: adenine deaminase [Bacteroidetes bacterium GWC2_40_22]OFY05459.1 MAG: adenine deaminase [Bacteroidetes bacterium GWE2_41_25]HBQ84443.1 adenine deaminase [Bacteroidales bacterium]HCU17721.1 adenine deaminase [Bacteroidales bacterium]